MDPAQTSSTLTPQSPAGYSRGEKVGIVLLNWNSWPFTLACLESLFRSRHPDFFVVVCDNQSSDGSLQHVRRWAAGHEPASRTGAARELQDLLTPPVPKPIGCVELDRAGAESAGGSAPPSLTLIQNGDNLGFAAGSNVGVRYALSHAADYVWLLNVDTLVRPDTLSHLLTHVRTHPDVATCGSTLLDLREPSRVIALGGGRVRRVTGSVWNLGENARWPLSTRKAGALARHRMDFVLGASMLMTRAFLETVGLMDEGYFLYYEEVDWAARMPSRMRLGYAPESVVYHHEGGTTDGLRFDHFYRSMLRYTRRHHRAWVPLTLLRLALRIPEAVVTGNRRQLVAILSSLRPGRSSREAAAPRP